MQNQQKPNYLALVLIAVIAFFVIRGIGGDGDDGGGDDLDIVARQAKISMVEYVNLVADDMDVVADEIDAGKLKTAVQIKEFVRARSEDSREKAFYDMGVLDTRNVPAEIKDDGSQVSKYFRTKADGHRSAVK